MPVWRPRAMSSARARHCGAPAACTSSGTIAARPGSAASRPPASRGRWTSESSVRRGSAASEPASALTPSPRPPGHAGGSGIIGGPLHTPRREPPMPLVHKSIPDRERLIFAMDVADPAAARTLAERLGDSVSFYKLGLELFMSGGYYELLDWMVARDKKIFVDLKFFDVPATVAAAVKQLRNRGVTLTTVHGNQAIMEAAAAAKGDVKVLAVTVLTSLDRGDLDDLGFDCDVSALVLSRARRALEAGCDGVIASGLEAPRLRQFLDHRLLVVTPGIRPVENRPVDDQKRTVDVAQAFANGADYIVVGRPIRDASDPRAAALAIQDTIAGVFDERAV